MTRKKREVWVVERNDGDGWRVFYTSHGLSFADVVRKATRWMNSQHLAAGAIAYRVVRYVPAPTKKKPKKWSDIRRQRITDTQHEQIRREVVSEIAKKKPKRRARR